MTIEFPGGTGMPTASNGRCVDGVCMDFSGLHTPPTESETDRRLEGAAQPRKGAIVMPEAIISQNASLVTAFTIRARSIGEDLVQTVDARTLHSFLEVGKVFAAWITDRIDQYGFIENADYVVFSETGKNPSGGRPAKEYAITLDMAKELSMVERNEKGKEARQYFIECERRAKNPDPALALSDPASLRHLLLENVEKVIALQGEVDELKPMAGALERIALSDGSLCITDAAKTLQVQPKALFGFLRAHHWIYTRQGVSGYIAYQAKLQSGLLEHKTTTVERSDGSEKTVTQVRVTPKGLTRLAREFEPVARAA